MRPEWVAYATQAGRICAPYAMHISIYFFDETGIDEKWEITIQLIVLNYIFCFEASGLAAQFSKCDFWDLWNFLDRNM